MKLYHLDRVGSLVDGQRIELQPLEKLSEEVRNSYFVKEFSEGVSQHGLRYLNAVGPAMQYLAGNCTIPAVHINALEYASREACSKMIELVFELVRRSYFSANKSRLTSLFAVKDTVDFEEWFSPEERSKSQIFELTASDDTPQYDGNLLREGLAFVRNENYWKLDFSMTGIFEVACMYWSGQSSEHPKYECLVPLPTTPIHLLPHQG